MVSLIRADFFADTGGWLEEVVRDWLPDCLVLDVRSNLKADVIESIKENGVVTFIIDDCSERRLAADMVFFPPVPQVQELRWRIYKGKRYVGWEWILLKGEVSVTREEVSMKKSARVAASEQVSPLRLLITMGGCDARRLTVNAMKAVDNIKMPKIVVVVIGPGFKWGGKIREYIVEKRDQYVIHEDVDMVSRIFVRADLAIASFGIIAYELECMGVPAILLCVNEDHRLSATSFVGSAIAMSLDCSGSMQIASLESKLRLLMRDKELREDMSRKGLLQVDGKGTERIAKEIRSVI